MIKNPPNKAGYLGDTSIVEDWVRPDCFHNKATRREYLSTILTQILIYIFCLKILSFGQVNCS